MAELITVTRSEVDYQAGRKATPTELNRIRVAIVETPATYAAPAQNDTAATHLVLPAGSRIMAAVLLSCAAGTAASTLSVGIRDAVTKVAIVADAILLNAAINAATTLYLFTGTKVITGQYYLVPQDAEIYLTFTGAVGTANQAIRLEIQWISP